MSVSFHKTESQLHEKPPSSRHRYKDPRLCCRLVARASLSKISPTDYEDMKAMLLRGHYSKITVAHGRCGYSTKEMHFGKRGNANRTAWKEDQSF